MGRLGDEKYDVAVLTAFGMLDHIAVQITAGTQKCLEHLRRHNLGRASFLLLNKMKKSAHDQSMETPEGAPRLSDLINSGQVSIAPGIFLAFGDILVAPDLETATRWVHDFGRQWRGVTRKDVEMVGDDAEGVSANDDGIADMLVANGGDGGTLDKNGSDYYDSNADGNTARDGSDKVMMSKAKEVGEDVFVSKKTDPRSKPSMQEVELSNPLIFNLADDPASVKTSRWFSNPLFEGIKNSTRFASFAALASQPADDDYEPAESNEEGAIQELDSDDEGDGRPTKKRKMKKWQSGKATSNKDDTLTNAEDII